MSVTDATAHAALTGARHPRSFSFRDAWSHEAEADRCWRCDAAPGETDVGLCGACHAALTDAT